MGPRPHQYHRPLYHRDRCPRPCRVSSRRSEPETKNQTLPTSHRGLLGCHDLSNALLIQGTIEKPARSWSDHYATRWGADISLAESERPQCILLISPDAHCLSISPCK